MKRKQFVIEMIHPEMANVAKSAIKAKLASLFKSKEECITVFGLKTKFGGGRSTGFALVYDNQDAKAKLDSKTYLLRVLPHLLNLRVGRLHQEGHQDQEAEEGNHGKSQEGQGYR